MPKEKSQFVPRWARTQSALNDYYALDNALHSVDHHSLHSARLAIRLNNAFNTHSVDSDVIRDTISYTQDILMYSGYELTNEVDSNFHDLRKVVKNEPLLSICKMQIEPFESGSFVIPAILNNEANYAEQQSSKLISSKDVLVHFHGLMSEAETVRKACLGTLTAIEKLGTVLSRKVSSLEYSISGTPKSTTPITVDTSFIERIIQAKQEAMKETSAGGTLEGILLAVDIDKTRNSGKGKLKLSINGQRERVSGTFTLFMLNKIISLVDKKVRLAGMVTQRNGLFVRVDATTVDEAD